jgi:hypothetical protein
MIYLIYKIQDFANKQNQERKTDLIPIETISACLDCNTNSIKESKDSGVKSSFEGNKKLQLSYKIVLFNILILVLCFSVFLNYQNI